MSQHLKISRSKMCVLTSIIFLVSCSSLSYTTIENKQGNKSPPIREASRSYNNTVDFNGNSNEVWKQLQHTSIAKLQSIKKMTVDPEQKAWVELALIGKINSTNTAGLTRALLAWRTQYPSHPGNVLFPRNETLYQLSIMGRPQRIALLLPQNGSFAASGHVIREGFLNAYYSNVGKSGKQSVKFYDTSRTKDMGMLYKQAVADGADFVIGPLVKQDVQRLSSETSFTAPTIALNYTEGRMSELPNNFYEYGLLPEDEIKQIVNRAKQLGYSQALVIAPQNAWGRRLVFALSNRWQALGGRILNTWYYSARSNFNEEVAKLLSVNTEVDKQLMQDDNDKRILEQQRRQDFDVIFLLSQPQDARIIVPLLRYYYASNVPIFATSSVFAAKNTIVKDVDLNGVTVCDLPWKIKTNNAEDVKSDRLYAVGQDAYMLSQTLNRLILLPYFPIYGTTGAMTMSPSHQIHRRLPCTTVRNGLA